jgi:hypothetical protein
VKVISPALLTVSLDIGKKEHPVPNRGVNGFYNSNGTGKENI